MTQDAPSPGVQTPGVQTVEVGSHHVGQRIDNFLLARLKGVPKSRIYRIIRKGEVRVNGKRVKPDHKLAQADAVRIPPLRLSEAQALAEPSEQLAQLVRGAVLYEDDDLLVINKPSGLPVHGGTGVRIGLIEALRFLHPERDFLELAHRLDKGTSGCLMVGLNGRALRVLFDRLRRQEVDKRYHLIVRGNWPESLQEVDAPLFRHAAAGGERFVEVSGDGKNAHTHFRVLRRLRGWTLVEARPLTGRTHQIRVHARHAGHPIAGDDKYGDP